MLLKNNIGGNILLNKIMQKKKPPNSIVNPAISSDSASAKSKGIRPVSNKNVSIKNGNIGK